MIKFVPIEPSTKHVQSEERAKRIRRMTKAELAAIEAGPSAFDDYPVDGPRHTVKTVGTTTGTVGTAEPSVPTVSPQKRRPKVHTKLRLDVDVIAAFKATGPGWQTRMNAHLREWLRLK